MQQLLIVLIFLVALGYLARRVYRSFAKKQTGCGKGCGCETDARPTVVLPKQTQR